MFRITKICQNDRLQISFKLQKLNCFCPWKKSLLNLCGWKSFVDYLNLITKKIFSRLAAAIKTSHNQQNKLATPYKVKTF